MSLYLESGFVNIEFLLAQKQPFIFCWGGRGTGKTYGALNYAVESGTPFLLLRRTQTQLEIISRPETTPFKALNRNRKWEIETSPINKYISGIYNGGLIGYCAALSTIANVRGFDGSDIELIIYDEFIPEPHARPIKNEFEAFCNAYETINRNRELQGKPPVQVLCLANANTIANPLFIGLGIVGKAERMTRTGQELSVDSSRGVVLANLAGSRISESKANTALYRLTGNGEFSQMAIKNTFAGDHFIGVVRSMPLWELTPVVCLGEICIYRHKSRDCYYCTTHRSGDVECYGVDPQSIAQFRKLYGWILGEYFSGKFVFENAAAAALLTNYTK